MQDCGSILHFFVGGFDQAVAHAFSRARARVRALGRRLSVVFFCARHLCRALTHARAGWPGIIAVALRAGMRGMHGRAGACGCCAAACPLIASAKRKRTRRRRNQPGGARAAQPGARSRTQQAGGAQALAPE